jgi:hypothetical protein
MFRAGDAGKGDGEMNNIIFNPGETIMTLRGEGRIITGILRSDNSVWFIVRIKEENHLMSQDKMYHREKRKAKGVGA